MHVVYPTSYRISQGHIVSNEDYTVIDGVITSTISTSIRVQNNALGVADPLLRSIYAPYRRCIALVDSNVDLHYKIFKNTSSIITSGCTTKSTVPWKLINTLIMSKKYLQS